MIDFIKNHLAKLSTGDWAGYKAELAPDAVYEELATRQRVSGSDAYVNLIQRWTRAFPDLKAVVKAAYTSGDKVIAEVTWEGTQRGPLDTPFGTIQPTNKFGKVDAVLIATVKNNKVVEMKHSFDILTILLQTGALPALGFKPPQVIAPSPAPRH